MAAVPQDGHIDQWNRIKNTETDLYIFGNLKCDQGSMADRGVKEYIF